MPIVSTGQISIVDVNDGTSPISVIMSNESCNLPANISGTVLSFANTGPTIKVYEGDRLLINSSSGQLSTGTWQVVSSTSDADLGITEAVIAADGESVTYPDIAYWNTGSAVLTAKVVYTIQGITYTGKSFTVIKEQVITKAMQGNTGNPASYYSLEADVAVIKKSASGTLTPAIITLKAFRNTTTKAAYSGRFKIYENGGTTASYTSTINESVKTYSTSNITSKLKAELYAAYGTTTLLDTQEFLLVEDGSSSIIINVGNANYAIPTAYDGTVATYIGSGTTITVKEGTTPLTYRTTLDNNTSSFSIGTPTVSASGTTITVGARSGDGTTTATVADHTTMGSEDVAIITYPITYNRANGSQATENVVQTITKSKQGVRGSRNLYASDAAYTSTYDYDGSATTYAAGTASYKKKATDIVNNATAGSSPRSPINGDTVTFSNNSDYVFTLTYDASLSDWKTPGTVIDGSLLVTGSVTAAKVDTRGLSIKDANGNVILAAGTGIDLSALGSTGGNNLVKKSLFSDGTIGSWYNNTQTPTASSTGGLTSGFGELRTVERDTYEAVNFPVTVGETLYVAADVKSTGNSYGGSVGLAFINSAGNIFNWLGVGYPANTAYTRYSGSITVPTNAVKAVPWLQIGSGNGVIVPYVAFSNIYISRVQENATVGAIAGTNLKDSAGNTVSDLNFLNKYSVTEQLAGDLSGNPFLTKVDPLLDRPAGIKASYGSSTASNISYYDADRTILNIYSATDTSIGAVWPAFRVQSNMRYRVFIRWKTIGATLGAGGIYFRFLTKATEIAQGKTHIGYSVGESSVDTGGGTGGSTAKVVSDTNGVAADSAYENVSPTADNTWYETVLEYAPSSTIKWASFCILNWTGIGAAQFLVDTCFIYPVTTAEDGATVGAPSGTYVGSTLAQTVESNAANGATAYTNLANKLDKASSDILKIDTSSATRVAGIVSGDLVWDASGDRTSGKGVAITPSGILAHNGTNETFAIDAVTGNATFAGALSAATGSFSGSLSAATGTFSGTLTASAINAVNTINIAGQAVTIPVSATTAGGLYIYTNISTLTNWELQSISFASSGAPISIFASFVFQGSTGANSTQIIDRRARIYRNGTLINEILMDSTLVYDAPVVMCMDTPGAGTVTYKLVCAGSKSGVSSAASLSNRTIIAIETKR